MADKRFHSVPEVRIVAVGGSPSSSDNIADVQSVNFNDGFQEALVRTAAYLNQFPSGHVRYDREVTISLSIAGFSEQILKYVNGSSATSSGGYDTQTVTETDTPDPFKLQLVYHNDANDKTLTITLPRCYCPGFSFDGGRGDYGTMQATIVYRPTTSEDLTYVVSQ